MFSYGLRFETQNFIADQADWAPRISLAWGVGNKTAPKTVIRTGFGVFFDRFSQQLQLQVDELNGTHQTEYVVNNPTFYSPTGYLNVPTQAQLIASGGAVASPTILEA